MVDPLLSVKNLMSGYGDIQILWGVDFHINEGEAVCLVGANGAGKSTLLRTLSGLLRVRSGQIAFMGQDLTNRSPRQVLSHGIVHVPEGRRLFGPMSVLDNLLTGAYLRTDRANIRHDLERMLDLFPILAERRHQAAGTLSGGEQQMCAIARGIMSKPKLLMIDELSLGLAPKMVDHLGEALQKVKREGLSLLLVEQDVATAFELTGRGIVLDSGRVSLIGPTEELSINPMVQQAYMGIA
ncbi:ABC transporter ATP-binding protein [Bradyrhizobium canariense]|uniref:Amino acid/amide ABC transporter ATP-binding protein 2, HAAT family n=1 Tax=Bradyrhizobium canariense TaxID=255045 RepID=A0A1H2AJS3_9BRAD|nr:ABC transporter ATP-binding protein [Bradyrhizobium canariense]SDT46213.1 amino acid/amide ABC transporter ATP-binding protein 2, HAAT family [Bradyrhizobium canariense]